jgi:drug/metabolite transporter (DMT)-like permease
LKTTASIRPRCFLKPSIELLFAGALWGYSFVGTQSLLRDVDAPALLSFRFLTAALLGFLILFLPKVRQTWSWPDLKNELRHSAVPGFFLFLTLALQTFGLNTTTPAKSAFITVLYVFIVPVIEFFFFRRKLKLQHFFFVSLALVGLAFFLDLNFDQWNWGDTLSLGGAVTASMHIIVIGLQSKRKSHAFILNLGQLFWTGLLSTLMLPWSTKAHFSNLPTLGWINFAILIFGCSLLAFFLQIRAQKRLSNSVASLLFLLESPFSGFFSFLFLGETFTGLQLIGGLLILLACAGPIYNSR